MKNTRPTERTIKLLCASSKNICAFPGCGKRLYALNESTGEICHIKGYKPKSARYDQLQADEERNAYDNLIIMCGTHHNTIDSNTTEYPVEKLLSFKANHELKHVLEITESDGLHAQILIQKLEKLHIEKNYGEIKAEKVYVKKQVNKVFESIPGNLIGGNQYNLAYIEYLIRVYNRYAKLGYHQTAKFHDGAISVIIANKFGTKWNHIANERFEELVDYLKGKIDKTEFGRNNKIVKGRNYHTYEENCLKFKPKEKKKVS